jgi:glycosyltransferase involved in cell wall biosynthesis
MLMLELVHQRAKEFDLLHFHLDYFPFSLFSRQTTPFVTTLHGRLDLPEHQPVFTAFASVPVVSISDAQRQPLPWARWMATIYHGMPENLLMPCPSERRYLAFLGRIAPEKAVDRAIRIATAREMPLKIAAKIDAVDRAYFETEIKSLLAMPGIEHIGEIGDQDKPAFLSGATALLVPVDWPEPFGLVMIEAMACGTPVIAYPNGSIPEVIEDGVTGFIVRNEDEAAAALDRLPTLDPKRIRQRFEERFTARRMALDYLDVYHALTGNGTVRLNQQPVTGTERATQILRGA